jgi:hypothetical protein
VGRSPAGGLRPLLRAQLPPAPSALLQFLDHAGRLGLGHVVVDLAACLQHDVPGLRQVKAK